LIKKRDGGPGRILKQVEPMYTSKSLSDFKEVFEPKTKI
jgi:hypothetical protein